MKIKSIAIVLSLIVSNIAFSQSEKCGTHKMWLESAKNDPSVLERRAEMNRTIENWISNHQNDKTTFITIPVVFHILYNQSNQNVSEAQIQSQLDILNEDFGLMNSDSLTPSSAFWNVAANTEIEFCLASKDPDGNATSGITRTFTDTLVFNEDNGNMRSSSTGGVDNWDPEKYLNFWVCELNGSTLGFAQFPDELSTNPDKDGVVVRHQCFGNTGTAGTNGWAEADLGRTATHEVGHWLGLSHIWGDSFCGDDMVADTPEHEEDNSGCPTEPHNANNGCGTGSDGEMFMNYMDYSDDACLVMFTFGQRDRMQGAINTYRGDLLTSDGCSSATGLSETTQEEYINIYPNPTIDVLYISLYNTSVSNLRLTSLEGKVVREMNSLQDEIALRIDVSALNKGMYILSLTTENGKVITERVSVQ